MRTKLQKKIAYLAMSAQSLDPAQVDLLNAMAMEMLPADDNDDGEARVKWELPTKLEQWARRRRANTQPGETLAAARKRWRSEGRCRDCGQLLLVVEDGRASGRRCSACRAGCRGCGQPLI